MPYKDKEARKKYFQEYYQKKKKAQNETKLNKFNSLSIKPVDSWEKPVYSEPLPLTEDEVLELKDGLTAKELNQSAKDIEDALEPGEIPEKYSHLPESSIREISRGISPLIYGIDSKNSVELDSITFQPKPKEPEDDPEVWTWEPRAS